MSELRTGSYYAVTLCHLCTFMPSLCDDWRSLTASTSSMFGSLFLSWPCGDRNFWVFSFSNRCGSHGLQTVKVRGTLWTLVILCSSRHHVMKGTLWTFGSLVPSRHWRQKNIVNVAERLVLRSSLDQSLKVTWWTFWFVVNVMVLRSSPEEERGQRLSLQFSTPCSERNIVNLDWINTWYLIQTVWYKERSERLVLPCSPDIDVWGTLWFISWPHWESWSSPTHVSR